LVKEEEKVREKSAGALGHTYRKVYEEKRWEKGI